MCRILKVKRANYYKWLHHKKSATDKENEELAAYIKRYDEMFDHTLGYRMMCDRINRDEDKHYIDKRVYKIMHILGLQSIIRKKAHSCTVRKKNNTADNKLKRDFNATRPNEKWVTDVTEFKYGKGNQKKLYLSAIMDLYDRTVVGYEISDHNDNHLVFNTIKQALVNNPGVTPLFHSDGGYQYTSLAFINMLKQQKIIQSMSRVHCCIDNGPMEGFWGILKCEMYKRKHFNTKEELTTMIHMWIRYYTYVRYQRRFGVQTPFEVRSEALKKTTPIYYPIPLNPRIVNYKIEHYK
jgi:putative transposase